MIKIDEQLQLAWLKYEEENSECFESDTETVFLTWADGYNSGKKETLDRAIKIAEAHLRNLSRLAVSPPMSGAAWDIIREINKLRE